MKPFVSLTESPTAGHWQEAVESYQEAEERGSKSWDVEEP
jgi:hypothetical protein